MKFSYSPFLFLLALILLVGYLFATNLPSPPPVYLFWISTVFLSLLIVWQIGKADSISRQWLVLAEIFLFGFVLYLIPIIPVPYGLFGGDIHREFHNAELILQHGWPIPEQVNLLAGPRINSLWPGIHLIGGVTSQLLGIELFTIAKWLPALISLCIPLIIFVLVKRMYGNSQVSLLVAFGTSALYYNIVFHTGFVRETPSYILFFLTFFFYIIYLTNIKNRMATGSLFILSLAALIISQHFTTLLLIIIILIFLITLYLANKVGERILKWPERFIGSISVNLTIPALTIVCFFSYLMYIGQPVLETLVVAMQSLVQPTHEISSVVSIERTLRAQTITLLRMFFSGIFSILIVTWIFKNREKTIIWNITGLLFAIFAFVLTMLGLFLPAFPWGGISRIEAFAWPFILIAATHAIFNLKYKNLLKYTVTALVIFNLFLIPPYIYDHNAEPAYRANEFSMSYRLSDYKAVEWFDGTGHVMGDVAMQEILSGLKQVPVYTDMDIYSGDLSQVENYDWLIFRAENFKVVWLRDRYVKLRALDTSATYLTHLPPDAYDRYAESSALIKVYSNGDVNVYKVVK